ncbi:Xenobiotic-transporting ATPase [Bertholletia excelsa]
MASLDRALGDFSWICEGELDFLASSCIHGAIVDILNLLFLLSYCLYVFVGFITKQSSVKFSRRDWVISAISICSALTSIAYFSFSLWLLIAQNSGFSHLVWVRYFVRGLIWIFLTISLLFQGSKWPKILISIWWLMFFLLYSAINTEIIVRTKIQLLDLLAWALSLLLLFCASRNLSHFVYQSASDKDVSQPLLVKGSEENCCQIARASFLSKLTFSWINHVLRLGNSKILALEDIPNLVQEDEAVLAYEKFIHSWNLLRREKGSNNAKNLVFWALMGVYKKEMVLVGVYIFLRTVSVVVAPLLLYGFVNYSNGETGRSNFNEGLVLVGCLVVQKVIESLSYRHFFFDSKRIGMRMRSALMVGVYKKQLKLSSLGRKSHSTGEVVNYIAVDAYRMGEFPMWLHLGWSYSLQLFLAICVLSAVVGIGVLPGLLPLSICGLLNVPFAKLLQKCQFEFMVAQDKRLRSMSEILNSMKIIKLQSWEEKFKNLVESYRENEFKWLAESQYKKSYGTALYWMSPTIISSVIFFGCVLLRSAPLDASLVFTVLAALRSMSEPVRMIPEALSAIIQVKVSFDRIESFLSADELNDEKLVTYPSKNSDNDTCVRIDCGNFSWDPASTILTLKNVNLVTKWGQKVAICGPVGAGKSSLLCAVLKEIPKISGNVSVLGSTAYVSQASWIQSGTIRDNILYGKPMEKTKYEKAIKACALDKDINSFDHGDLTEIGQRGLNMSGGQKQRIQLARAVYHDADIYLLDDPFSAVDAHTAATLFNDCVMTALEKKTVILVTHQVEFLSEVDKILVMEGGKVTQSGSYQELLMAGTAFEQLVNAHRNAVTGADPKTNENGSESEEIKLTKENSEGEISAKARPGIQLTEEEEKEIGDVGWKPFWDYFLVSKGVPFLSLSIIAHAAFVAFQAFASFWLAFAIPIPSISRWVLIGVYAAISSTSALFVYFRSLFAAILGLKASKAFFSGFINSIFGASMSFFDSTPVGRILTRASSDLSVVDFDIPFSLAFVYAAGMEMIATIGIMASVTWQVLIVAIPATVASKYVQGYYQSSARELMRINGMTKAPVMNYAAETALGVVTIRAFNMEERFYHNYLKLIDTDAKTFMYSNAALEWLVLRVETLQNITLFTAAFLLVLLPQNIDPGLVGLSLSYALALTGTQVFMTRWYSSLCNYIISVERIKQFMNIPPEPPAIVEDKRPPPSWPSKGRIELQDLKIRYRENAPLVLKGITCTFKEGNKVGVVGRTGSGKTTLISALFRLIDPASGRILVDGLDICSIGLKDLRMKLSIIPQEPTLFKGSVRTNLDPLELYSDEEIWKALEKCQLKATISSLPNLLDSSVSDEGENWSIGQRQLFCLGRILLKRNRILVLDEATASIDSATDAILQRIIREEFSDCTVVTVAHRVPTVIDSDMVMVLSFGKLVEYDEPSKLMETNSSFSKLVAEYWASCRRNSAQSFIN